MSNMSDPVVRFWAVEHMSGMLIGIILITIGRARGKRKDTDLAKHKTFAIFYIIGLIIILAMIPWPGREGIGRALLPS
jgi:L-asparagine transporter-like permease